MREKSLSVFTERDKELETIKQKLKEELLQEFGLKPLVKKLQLDKIKEMVESQEKVGVSDCRAILRIKSVPYTLRLMRETAEKHSFVFVKGGACRESYLTEGKFTGVNKVMWAFSETYKYILSQSIGTTKRVSSIAKEFDLNHEELQAVVGKLAQQPEIYVQIGSRFQERRIKRVR